MYHTSLPTPPTSLADAFQRFEDGAFDAVWSETYRKKLRGSLSKAAKVYAAMGGVSAPALIPCDVAELEGLAAPFLKGRTAPEACGFKTFLSFVKWVKHVRSFYEQVSGARAARAAAAGARDDWADLLDHVVGRDGGTVLLNTYERIPLTTLARECRARGVALRTLTAADVGSFAPALPSPVKDTVKRGYQRLVALGDDPRVPAALLPVAPLGPLPALTSPAVRTVPSLTPALQTALDAYIAKRLSGEEILDYGTETHIYTTDGISPSRAKNIAVAVRWYWHGAVALGISAPDKPLDVDAITRPKLLAEVVDACASGALGPICTSETRRAMCQSVIAFLEHLRPGYRTECNPKLFGAKALKGPAQTKKQGQAKQETAAARHKRTTCLRFIDDKDMQRRFYTMPTAFFSEARDLIARFHELGPVEGGYVSRSQHRALDLAIMAALTTIVTRYPLRLATSQQLLLHGPDAHVLFPTTKKHCQTAMLDIPGTVVKNGRYAGGVPLAKTLRTDPRSVLEWYRDAAHPLVLKYKPKKAGTRNPLALFCGLHIETLRRIWRAYVPELDLPITAHMCRHVLATHLYANGVPIEQIAALLCDSIETTAEAYTFVDEVRQISGAMEAGRDIFRGLGI